MVTEPVTVRESTSALAERLRASAIGSERFILGLAGAPGAGKSTLADALVADLNSDGECAVALPMDGFHLPWAAIADDERALRRGAPDTFDPGAYGQLLAHVRDAGPGEAVRAPAFDREIEDPVANAIEVRPEHRIVVTEGNYLLLGGPWAPACACLDEVWYLDLDPDVRRERLVDRHVAFGKEPDEARAFVLGSDERNAGVVGASRDGADLVVIVIEDAAEARDSAQQ